MPTNNEKILLNYLHQVDYSQGPQNQVGTDADFTALFPDDSPVRTVPTPSGDIAYVRKFGTPYLITQVTDIEDPVDVDMTFTVKALDGTTLGSRTGGGAFVAGSTLGSAQGCYLEVSATGACTILTTILIDTDVDAGGLDFACPGESLTAGMTRTLYLSDTASTYYDSAMKYGGARHTPALGDARKPYFHPYDAYAALNSSNDGVEFLDSETYSFPYRDSGGTWREGIDMATATTYLYSAINYSPRIIWITGASIYREQLTTFSNVNTKFFNENGDAANNGSWQSPYATFAQAAADIAGRTYIVYGGSGATVDGFNGIEISASALNVHITAEYGYTPAITGTSLGGSSYALTMDSFNATDFDGFIINAGASYACVLANAATLSNCTISGGNRGIYVNQKNINVKYNDINSCPYGIFITTGLNTTTIVKNRISNCSLYGIYLQISLNTTTTINDNLIYSNGTGLRIDHTANTLTATFINNTLYKNTIGINYVYSAGTNSCTFRDNIINSSISLDLSSSGITPVITESAVQTSSGWTVGGTNTTSDPILSDPDNVKFGINPLSPCYRTGTSNDDMGAKLRIIEINNDSIHIQGIKFDLNNLGNTAIYILDTADHTGTRIENCRVENCAGISIDLYDDGTDLDSLIYNNIITNNGTGVYLPTGGNFIKETIFSRNIKYGIYIGDTYNSINHCVFFSCGYGIYIAANSGATIYNSIIMTNSIYGIYSAVSVIAYYCDILDSVNSNVDISDTSNINNNPLFVNTDIGTEDFRIKTIELGYDYNSACKDAGSDGYDIGAYLLSRTTSDDYWKKIQYTYNPRNVDFSIVSKGGNQFESGTGTQWLWGKGRKRRFNLKWQTGQYSSETDRKTNEYLISLYQRADNELSNEQIKVRFSPLPSQGIDSGTAATVSATAKTITDSTQTWVKDELKGYYVGVKYASGSATGSITAATRTLNVNPSPTWTVDAWIGYYFFYNGYFYYIQDNDADDLILSDPDSTLSNVSNINWTIEKYFKILSNTATALTVQDDDGELVTGSYDYIVRFIECHVISPDISFSQPRYYWQKEEWKTGYELTLEEI